MIAETFLWEEDDKMKKFSRNYSILLFASIIGIIFTLIFWRYILVPWIAPYVPWLQPIVIVSHKEIRNVMQIDVPGQFYRKDWVDLTQFRYHYNPAFPATEEAVAQGELLFGSFALWLFVFADENSAQSYFQNGIIFLNEVAENKGSDAILTEYKLYEELDLGDENLIYYSYSSKDMLNPNATRHMLFVRRCQTVALYNIIDYDSSQSESVAAVDVARQLDKRIHVEMCLND